MGDASDGCNVLAAEEKAEQDGFVEHGVPLTAVPHTVRWHGCGRG